MNDGELNELLKRTRTPELPEDYWNDSARRILVEARRRPIEPPARPAWFPRLAWSLTAGVAVIGLVCILAIDRRSRPAQMAGEESPLGQQELVREVMELFPNRLSAIVQDERGMRLVLSERADIPVSTPVFIEVCDRGRCVAVVTFSGQEVRIGRNDVTVLSDAQGGVLLVGDSFLWSSREPRRAADGLRIQARELGEINAG